MAGITARNSRGQKHNPRSEDGEIRRIPELVEVKDPVLSVLAGTQRDLLLSIARTEDIFSGFLPRFAFVVPDRRRRRKDVSLVTPDTERCSSTLIAHRGRLAALFAFSDAEGQFHRKLHPGHRDDV